MFSGHFQNIYFYHHLSGSVVVARDACFILVLHKVLIRDWKYILQNNFFLLHSLQCRMGSHTMEDYFYNISHEVFSIGCILESLNQELINIIPKNTTRYSIGGWRMITLLSVPYKIVAKDLSRRVRDVD